MASPRTTTRPIAGRSCAAVLSGARPQCRRSWVSLGTGAEPHGGAEPGLSADPTWAPEHITVPEWNLSEDGRQASVETRAGPHCGLELVLSGEQSQASEEQSHASRRSRAELQ